MSLEKFYKKYIRRELLRKYNINSIKDINELRSIRIAVDWSEVDSVEDRRVIEGLKFLELIGGQKAMVEDLGGLKGARGYASGRKVRGYVTLRKEKMYRFLEYMIFLVFPVYVKRYGNLLISEKGVGFWGVELKDINIFQNIKSEAEFKDKLIMEFEISGKREGALMLLSSLYVPIKKGK